MTSIYILKLDKGKYYVGKSNHVRKKYNEHLSGNGVAWTRLYKPISIHRIIKHESPFHEDKITKEYMFLYGIHNVRGGSYVEVELQTFQLRILYSHFVNAVKEFTVVSDSESVTVVTVVSDSESDTVVSDSESVTVVTVVSDSECVKLSII